MSGRVQISLGDLQVGQRVWMDTHHAVFKKGYITYSDHQVTKISLYADGSIHCISLVPSRGGLEEHVERRRIIAVELYQDEKKEKRVP